MENRKEKIFTIFAITFSIVLGSLLHFTYERSNNNTIVGLFSAVNESVWEHLKLVFYPMLFASCLRLFLLKSNKNYLESTAIGIITSMGLIIILFYTYLPSHINFFQDPNTLQSEINKCIL